MRTPVKTLSTSLPGGSRTSDEWQDWVGPGVADKVLAGL